MSQINTPQNPFIAQTARDYDMPYHIAEAYYKKHGDNTHDFYAALESYIKDRASK